jgi:signal transduction histidine kinase
VNFTLNRHIGLLLLLLATRGALVAQKMELHLTHYSKAQGLPDHRITSVLEHRNGFVYLGTWNGLGRFDGTGCIEIPLPDQCIQFTYPGNYISELRELADGRIMILRDTPGQQDCPVLIYNPHDGRFTRSATSEQQAEDRWLVDGVLTETRPLLRRTNLDEVQTATDHRGNRLTWSVKESVVRAELILTGESPIDFAPVLREMADVLPVPFGADFSKHVFFASSNGLFKVDVQKRVFSSYLAKDQADWQYGVSSRYLYELPDGRMLFGTDFGSLFVKDAGDQEAKELKPFNSDSKRHEYIGPVRGIHPVGGNEVALVLREGSVLRYDFVREEFRKIVPLSKPSVRSTAKYQCSALLNDTILCISDYNKLITFDLKNGRIVPSPAVTAMLTDYGRYSSMIRCRQDGTVWYGTVSALFHLDPLRDRVLFVYTDSIAPVPPAVPRKMVRRVLPVPTVYDVYQENDSISILATDGGGVVRLDMKKGTCRQLSIKDGLADNTVCSIERGHGGYWLGTYHGLSYMDTSTFQFTNYFRENGLPHNELNRSSSYSDGRGGFYFGTMNGVFRFDESAMTGSRDSCRILISGVTSFDADGKTEKTLYTVTDGQEFLIPAGNRSLHIALAMDEFHNPAGHRYFYQLARRGDRVSEEKWLGLGPQSSLRFEYLEAGNYSLLLRGVSSDGNPSQTFTVNLRVEEFFYRRWWFIALVLLVAGAMLYAVYRHKVQKALQIERLKNQLSIDLHDEVGSVLSGVAYQMDLLSFSVHDEHKTAVQRVASSSRKAMAQLRDVVWAVNPGSAGTRDFFERMKEFSAEQLEPLNIQCFYENLLPDYSLRLATEVRHALFLIFKEFLTNTIKHSGGDTVRVTMRRTSSAIILELKDNGKGLSEENLGKTGMGLKSMRNRIIQINGKFEMFNDNGLTVRVSAPL